MRSPTRSQAHGIDLVAGERNQFEAAVAGTIAFAERMRAFREESQRVSAKAEPGLAVR